MSPSRKAGDRTPRLGDSIAIDKEACRYSHQEIAQISGNLYQGRMGDADMKSILEVLVEHIQNGTSEAPQKEERRY